MGKVSRLLIYNIAPKTRMFIVDKRSKDTLFLEYVSKKALTINVECGRVYIIKATNHKYESIIARLEVEDKPLTVIKLKQEKIPTIMDNIMKKFKHIFKHK